MAGRDDATEDIDCTMTTRSYAPKLKPPEVAFLKFAIAGNIEKMKLLLTKRVNVNCVNELDRAAVHFAAASGNDKVIRFLRENLAEFDVQDKLGMTPIHWAAYYGHVEIVKHLALSYRVRLDLLNKEGMTILHVAAYNGQDEVVEAIKMYIGRLKPSQRDRRGRTPLHLACEEGHIDVVKVLLSFRGCNIDAKDSLGRTPLHCAAECGQINAIDRLINMGADLNLVDNNNRTPLYLAAETGQLEALQAIADVESIPFIIPPFEKHNKETIMHIAARRNYYKIIEEFAYRCKMNAYNADGHTALHVAVLANHLEAVRSLLRFNANVNQLTHRHQTALHLAVEQNNAGIVFLLLQCSDIHLNIPDKKKKTPLYLATQGSFLAITDMFIRTMIKRGLTGEVMTQSNVSVNITHSMKGYRGKATRRRSHSMFIPSKKKKSHDCECDHADDDHSSEDNCDPLCHLPVISLQDFKNLREAQCTAENVQDRVYAKRFRDACWLMKRVMRRRFHALHPQAELENEESEEEVAVESTGVANLFSWIKTVFGTTFSRKFDEDGLDGTLKWFTAVDSAVTSNKQKSRDARSKRASAITRRSTKAGDEAGILGNSKMRSLGRPHISLDNSDGLYDIFHGLGNYGPSNVNYNLLDRVFYNLSHDILTSGQYDAFATELGFAPQHSKSVREQYGDKAKWECHFYRLMRIWLSTKEYDEYSHLMKDLCQALSKILEENQIDKARKNWLKIEDDYSEKLLEDLTKKNKAQEQVLKDWQKAVAKKRKEMEKAEKKKSKELLKLSKVKNLKLAVKTSGKTKNADDGEKKKEETEQQNAAPKSESEDTELESALSAAITFPDSFDSGIHRDCDDDNNNNNQQNEKQESSVSRPSTSSGNANEAFIEEETKRPTSKNSNNREASSGLDSADEAANKSPQSPAKRIAADQKQNPNQGNAIFKLL